MSTEFDLPAVLAQAIEAHGIGATIVENRVVVPESGLVFIIQVKPTPPRPDTTLIELDIGTYAKTLDKSVIWNCFAGIGVTRPEAERNALGKFVLGPFHALLSALGNHKCPSDGVDWLDWSGPSGSWRICSSPLLVQGGDPTSVGYSTFNDRLKELFESDVAPGLHWCEVFFASLDGKLSTAEVRLDNVMWTRASEALALWHVAPELGYRSGRHFFVALPAFS